MTDRRDWSNRAVHSPYQILWIPAFAGMTGSGRGRNWIVQRQGGFQIRPYQVVASLPFNTRVLDH